jgi:hypothetical protein
VLRRRWIPIVAGVLALLGAIIDVAIRFERVPQKYHVQNVEKTQQAINSAQSPKM